ncbi:Oligosaccharyl transferase subunit, putative [Desulfurococcus amylolyticus 1221n]|uniref:dolichyl-phosphooligosaccharide-protein glycotransferase n=1 Tax=Desulfurococcus amylolyticus (strain DSM 18924 / JCM 16383 / VKM B-2413 / 1221n) TaxID=490899 RepID=B8D352_DESA1|nr:STT3 domain-containing protein [Desulfurococcus amylolyticus]ACL10465.1 Oligosaccharyl transferase subunit, putative [Desulfurococcus amylolyticus 1221n]
MSVNEAVSNTIYKVYEYFIQHPRAAKTIMYILLALILVYGVYVRFSPYWLNGFEFFEFDSYIEYWQAKYVYENGLLSWYTLTRDNPATHIFWYPWGRDIIYTSYPFLPIWTGTTYHLVEGLGLTLKEWGILQPLIFAAIGIILAYITGRELSNGNRIAGLIAALLIAILPAATERTVIGYIEKEGVAIVPLLLYIYFYSKLAKSINRDESSLRKALYTVLSGFFLAVVGWLWGGYVFILGTMVAFTILYPLLTRSGVTREFLIYQVGLIVLSMVFVMPSPANASNLGVYPFNPRELGTALLSTLILPVIYYLFNTEYKKLGFKKPLLTKGRYFILLVLLVIGGAVLITRGYIPIGGRLAWALGLRFIPATPLVESIAEHQSPLSSYSTLVGMLHSWGVYPWLFYASPLILSIIGALYFIYRGEPDKLYVSIAFLLAFYSYLNAAYMIAIAAYFGTLVMGVFIGRLFEYIMPTSQELIDRRKGRVRYRQTRGYRVIVLAILVLALINIGYAGYTDYASNTSMIYTLKAGVSGLPFYTDSWYKAVELMRSLPNDSLVIAWWDYGYGISVDGGKASVADGSTLNETQIGIIGLIMSSINTSTSFELAGLFNPPLNNTYLMAIDSFIVSSDNTSVTIWPIMTGGMPGTVDIPKSIWMIRIGNSTVDRLRALGINISYVDTTRFIYVYNFQDTSIISPVFDSPNTLPLLYKMLMDGVMYWAELNNKSYTFKWFTGSQGLLDSSTASRIKEVTGLDVKYYIQARSISSINTRPLANDTYIKPFRIIMEPFINPWTGQPVRISTPDGGNGILYSIIVFYQLNPVS